MKPSNSVLPKLYPKRQFMAAETAIKTPAARIPNTPRACRIFIALSIVDLRVTARLAAETGPFLLGLGGQDRSSPTLVSDWKRTRMPVEQTRPPRRIIGQMAPPPGGHTELNPLTF